MPVTRHTIFQVRRLKGKSNRNCISANKWLLLLLVSLSIVGIVSAGCTQSGDTVTCIYTSNDSILIPTGVSQITNLVVVGAGGGGGGGGGDENQNAGAGGFAGSTSAASAVAVSSGFTYEITAGIGGTGGTGNHGFGSSGYSGTASSAFGYTGSGGNGGSTVIAYYGTNGGSSTVGTGGTGATTLGAAGGTGGYGAGGGGGAAGAEPGDGIAIGGNGGTGGSGYVSFDYAQPVPVSSFTADPTTGYMSVLTTFTDTSTNTPTGWIWNFTNVTGNNTPVSFSTSQHPSQTFGVGNFLITLNATNEGGSNISTQVTFINVSMNAPVANFTSNTTSGYATLYVQFTDTSTNTPSSWEWAFGDGGTSTQQNPICAYTNAGVYTVTLNATNAGGSNTVTKTSYITVTAAPTPVANFTGTPRSGNSGTLVQFTDTSTNIPTAWNWTFGDGNYSNDQNPNHTYNVIGSHTIILTVENAYGSNTSTKVGYITITSPLPVANFSAIPTTGDIGTTVQFTDLSTNSPTSWNWSFGDGMLSPLQNPSYTYNALGSYKVTLTVTNTYGNNTLSRSGYINIVGQTPVASYTSNVTAGAAPLAVQFNDTTMNYPTAWNWSFGDGNYSNEQNPVYVYNSSGLYTVSLTVVNPYGTDTVTKSNLINTIVGVNRQDLSLTPQYRLIIQFLDQSGDTINVVKVIDSTGNTTTTTNGTYIGYYSYGVVAISASATGYGSLSENYIMDHNQNVTMHLSSTSTSSQTQYVTTKVVRFVCQNYNGEAITGMNTTLNAISSSIPVSWVSILFGINLETTPVLNTTMSGITGTDGSITYVMVPTSKYSIWYNAPSYGINETRYYYPSETEYIETFFTQTPVYATAGISTDFYTYRNESNGTILLGIYYNDTYSSTDNLTFTVMDEHRNIIYQTNVVPI